MKNIQPKHIAITTAILTFITIITGVGFLAVVIIPCGLYLFVKSTTRKKSHNIDSIKKEAREYIEAFKENEGLPVIETTLLLEQGEHAFLEAIVPLYETRAVRYHQGAGAGFKIAKGVSIGGYQGRSESKQEWRKLDEGTLVLTNKRVLFVGNEQSRTIPLKKIFNANVDGLGFIISYQKKNVYFENTNPAIWVFAIDILRQGVGKKDISLVQE